MKSLAVGSGGARNHRGVQCKITRQSGTVSAVPLHSDCMLN